MNSRNAQALTLAAVLAGASTCIHASIIQVDISGLDTLGPQIGIAFDLIDGDGPSNSILLGAISTDGTAGPATFQGGASAQGSNFLLEDTEFFNSILLEYVGASAFSLRLDTTNTSPAPGMFADTLAVYLIDLASGMPALFTDELLGTNALLSWTATGQEDGDLAVYQAAAATQVSWAATFVTPNNVPEPGTLSLAGLGMAGMLLTLLRRREGQA